MSEIVWDAELVNLWYKRNDIYHLIVDYNNFKYVSFMCYGLDGKSFPPRRFQIMVNNRKGYDWTLNYNGVLRKPTSFYRDVDNWKTPRKFFNINKEIYKEERKEFFANGNYRNFIHSTDFIFDIDGENVYDSWNFAFKLVTLLKKFNVMFCIYCSGKKGFQLLIPYHKSIKKEYIKDGDFECNTHEVFAFNLKKYLNDEKDNLDLCIYGDLRFVKQQFSIDCRSMCPIIPLTYDEFIDFKNYENKENKYMNINYWLKVDDFLKRGFSWFGKEPMFELVENVDKWVEQQ